MSDSQWQSCYSCGNPGACITVQNGSRFDQMSTFRGHTLSNAVAIATANITCQYQEQFSDLLSQSDKPVQSLSCVSVGQVLALNITLNAAVFKLTANRSLTVGTIAGAQFVSDGSATRLISQVNNTGAAAATFSIKIQNCCMIFLVTISCVNQNITYGALNAASGQVIELRSPPLINLTASSSGGCSMLLYGGGLPLLNFYAPFPNSTALSQQQAGNPQSSPSLTCASGEGTVSLLLQWQKSGSATQQLDNSSIVRYHPLWSRSARRHVLAQ